MRVATVSTSDGSLLRGVRETLSTSDSALLCVAFVHERGLGLIKRELEALRGRGAHTRLLVTTTFDDDPGPALGAAAELGCEVKVLNPGGRSYHPKLYLGAGGQGSSAVIGSANLTAGLATNFEIGVRLEGSRDDLPLREAWEWAEARWSEPRATLWTPTVVRERSRGETFDDALFAALCAEVQRNPVFLTLGRAPAKNVVLQLTEHEAVVETAKSAREGPGGQSIPAWMFNLAWVRLKRFGELSNDTLLNDLRVMRSSAVLAILARLPGVKPVTGKGIGVRLA